MINPSIALESIAPFADGVAGGTQLGDDDGANGRFVIAHENGGRSWHKEKIERICLGFEELAIVRPETVDSRYFWAVWARGTP